MEWTAIYAQVKEELSDALAVDSGSITLEKSLGTDLGADSLDVMDLIVRLNRRFDLQMSTKELQTRLLDGDLGVARNDLQGAADANDVAVTPVVMSMLERRKKIAEMITVQALTDLVAQELKVAEKAR